MASFGFAAFGSGNLAVLIVGTGTSTLSAVATRGRLVEFTTSGVLTGSSVTLPCLASDGAHVTFGGNTASVGFVSRTVDKRFLVVGGHDLAEGSASGNSADVNRTVARVSADGSLLIAASLTDAFVRNSFRSVASLDGSSFYLAGHGVGTAPGECVRLAGLGSITSIPLYDPFDYDTNTGAGPGNTRVVRIFDLGQGPQLFCSSQSVNDPSQKGFVGIAQIGHGLPVTGGNTYHVLPGMPLYVPDPLPSPYDFAFSDANTLYIADDRDAIEGGGIQKWTFDGTKWNLGYTIPTGAQGPRGLTMTKDGSGHAILFATTSEASGNRLVKATDLGAGSAATTIATAPTNTAFRGLDWTPVNAQNPISGTFSLGGVDNLWAASLVFSYELRQGSTVKGEGSFTCNSSLQWSIGAPSTGTYSLWIKGRPFLGRIKLNVASGSTNNNFSLVNGDIDGDNSVTVFDYGVLSDYFDKSSGDADWSAIGGNGSAPRDADVDGDAAVTVFDYGVLSDNFDAMGDD